MHLFKICLNNEDRPSQIAVLPVIEASTGRPLGLLRLHDVYQPRAMSKSMRERQRQFRRTRFVWRS